MSKTVSTTLAFAQKAETRHPYLKVEYYKDGTTWTDVTSDLVLPLDYQLRPYDGSCPIYLNNRLGKYDTFSQAGRQVRITAGLYTGQGPEYQSTDTYLPYLWIVKARGISQASTALLELLCEPIWGQMERELCDEDKSYTADGGDTIKDILTYVLAKMSITLGTSISEDSHIDTDEPEFELYKNESILSIVQRLMEMTDCWLVPRTNTVHIKHCQSSDAAVATYYTVPPQGKHSCFWYIEDKDYQYVPTKVVVEYDSTPTTTNYDASEPVTYQRYVVRHDLDSTEALALATSMVTRGQVEAGQGSASMPIDFVPEMYDVVTITEGRTGPNRDVSPRIGGIRYYVGQNVYNMGLAFGGVYRGIPIPVEVDPGTPEEPTVPEEPVPPTPPQEPVNIAGGAIPKKFLSAEELGYPASLQTGLGRIRWKLPTEMGWSMRRLSQFMSLLGPGLGSALSLQTPLLPRIPLTTVTTDLNVDLDDIDDGSTYVKLSATKDTKIDGIEAGADVTGDHQADVDIDNITDGSTYKKITASDQTKLAGVEAGADVTGDHQADVNIDNVTDGSTYKKFSATEQTKLTGIEAGADVTASHEAATVAAFTGRDLDDLSDGSTYKRLHTASGNVVSDSNGIAIKGGYLVFKNSAGTLRGCIEGTTSTFQIFGYDTIYIDCGANNIELHSPTVMSNATVKMTNLPTSDPGVAGKLWSNSGVVTVSSG